jgi:hypothetical protein
MLQFVALVSSNCLALLEGINRSEYEYKTYAGGVLETFKVVFLRYSFRILARIPATVMIFTTLHCSFRQVGKYLL